MNLNKKLVYLEPILTKMSYLIKQHKSKQDDIIFVIYIQLHLSRPVDAENIIEARATPSWISQTTMNFNVILNN